MHANWFRCSCWPRRLCRPARTRSGAGPRQHGQGDTSLVLKRAISVDSATGLGLELGWKLPTAKDAIGSGKCELTLNGIFSKDIGAIHIGRQSERGPAGRMGGR